jgi:hypothetical protein
MMGVYGRALRLGWDVSEEERKKAKGMVLQVMADPTASNAMRLKAVMVLAYLDRLDMERERTEVLQQAGQERNQTDVLRTMLQTPEGRKQLADQASVASKLLEEKYKLKQPHDVVDAPREE